MAKPPLKGLRVVDLIRERAVRMETLERRQREAVAHLLEERKQVVKELRKLQADTQALHRAIGIRLRDPGMLRFREDPRVQIYLDMLGGEAGDAVPLVEPETGNEERD